MVLFRSKRSAFAPGTGKASERCPTRDDTNFRLWRLFIFDLVSSNPTLLPLMQGRSFLQLYSRGFALWARLASTSRRGIDLIQQAFEGVRPQDSSPHCRPPSSSFIHPCSPYMSFRIPTPNFMTLSFSFHRSESRVSLGLR